MAGSLSSSFGSPGSDLAEMRDLKRNFSNQEELLGQLRDALQSSSGRGKESGGDYASRLAQMRSARRPGGGSGTGQRSEPEERGGRMQMLRKQLDESKARQEAELRSRQELESIVTGLQRELEERDQMISSLNMSSVTSSVLGSPFVMSPQHGSPGDSPGDTTPPTGAGALDKHLISSDWGQQCLYCNAKGCAVSLTGKSFNRQLRNCLCF